MSGLLEGQGVLISGGTGTFARAFIPHCLAQGARRIVAFARHEVEMAQLEADFGPGNRDQMRYYLGDVRDRDRLQMAMDGIDVVIHAAALKRIEQCERDPLECIAVNIGGSVNVVAAVLKSAVTRCLLLSTDKAVAPVNLYGASKMAAERLFIAANNVTGPHRHVFGVVRYGNIWASRGSVIHQWRTSLSRWQYALITDPEATRFFMPIQAAVELVQQTLDRMPSGPTDIVIPKLDAYRLGDLAAAANIGPLKTIGLPPWEKPHETLDGITYSNNVRRMTMQELRDEIAKLRAAA